MAPRFIGKTSLVGLSPLTLGGEPVLGRFGALSDALRARAGGEAAALFAEPVVTWGTGESPGSISWYSELTGEAEPLAALPADRRAGPESRLRQVLQRLQPLLTDPELGSLLRRALALRHPGSLLAVGSTPVLIDWGLTETPSGTEEEQATRGTSWMQQYVPTAAAPAVAAPPGAAMAPRLASAVVASAPVRVTSTPAFSDWALLPAALVTAGVFLGVGLWAGARMVAARMADRPSTVTLLDEHAAQEALERQRQANAALMQEIEARRRLLAGNVCVPDPSLLPRLGPDRAAGVSPGAVAPLASGPFQGSLADLLTQAVVLVVAPRADGTATGSGFFIAPNLVVTNRHVIEDADPARLVVTSKKLGHLTAARIKAQTPSSEIGGADVALLQVDGVDGVQPLAFSTTAATLDPVIAAGFPGLLLQSDEAFDRLRQGDASAVPEVILTDGKINAIQSAPGGMKIMPHSAAVSGGNSGGPLVDACGRVLGINTFITANREQVVHANYAQKSDGVIAFLRENGVTVTDVTAPCTPVPAPPPAQPVAPAAAAAPGPAPR